jgi:hypothetical protein
MMNCPNPVQNIGPGHFIECSQILTVSVDQFIKDPTRLWEIPSRFFTVMDIMFLDIEHLSPADNAKCLLGCDDADIGFLGPYQLHSVLVHRQDAKAEVYLTQIPDPWECSPDQLQPDITEAPDAALLLLSNMEVQKTHST